MERVRTDRNRRDGVSARLERLQSRCGQVWAESLESRLFLSAAFDVVGLTALRADGSYAGVDGSNIGVVVIDTGAYSQHPDLAPNFAAWYDAVLRTSGNAPFDPDGHGTHVAGTIAARNPEVGVATQARVISVRALTAENEPYPDHNPVLEALSWVIDHVQQYNIRVINMSLGSPSNLNGNLPSSPYQPLFAELERLGVTIVAASGNSYANYVTPGVSTPSAYATLSVANTWEDDGRGDRLGGFSGSASDRYVAYEADAVADRFAASSQRGTLINQVAAPGSTIYSLWNGEQGKLYNTISGTSMASPLVAGMVALMQDAAFTYGGTYLSPGQIRNIITASADNVFDGDVSSNGRAELTLDAQGRPQVGPIENLPETGLTFKRVNVYRAIQQVRAIVTGNPGNPGEPPPPTHEDTNATMGTAISLPSLDGTRTYTFTGHVGNDGSVVVGNNDIDLFKIVIESPGVVTFQTSAVAGGTAFDAYLRLFNSAGAEIAFSDDSGGTLYPTLTSVRLQPGTYYFGITSYNNSAYEIAAGGNALNAESQGDYNLTVSLANPDPNGVFQGAVAVGMVPQTYAGFIGADLGQFVGSQDVDFFDIVAPDTGTLIIDIDTTQYPQFQRVDSYVRVFNSIAEQIAFNDDEVPDGPNLNLDSYLEIQVVRGQRLYIAVADYWNQGFDPADPFDRTSGGMGGLYDLILSFRNGDITGTINSAVQIGGNAIYDAAIGNDGGAFIGADGGKDVDFFGLTSGEDGLLDVSITSPDGSLNAVASLWLYDAQSGSATRVSSSPVGAPRHIFRVLAGQTYYIAVTGQGNNDFNWSAIGSGSGGDTGNYTLTSHLRPLSDLAALSDNMVNGATPREILLGGSISDEVGRDGSLVQGNTDVDIYRFVATVTGMIEIRTDTTGSSDGGAAQADTFLRIFDAAGNEIVFNDDGYIGTVGSFLRLNVTAGQTYYIGVNGNTAQSRAYDPITGAGAVEGPTGSYVLSVETAAELHAQPGGRVEGSVTGQGTALDHTITAVNANGQPILFQKLAGESWRAVELRAVTGAPQITGPVVTWVDPKDGLTYAAAPSAEGVLLFTNAAGHWSFRNLTTEIAGASVVVSEISAFAETSGIVNIAGLNSAGELVLYTQSGEGSAGGYAWRFTNLVTRDLAPQGMSMPQFAEGRFVTYVTGWNGLNIAGLSADGDIYTVWWAPGLDKWEVANLSDTTGAPTLSGGLTVYLTAWGGINLAGLDQQGRISVTWWVPGFGSNWVTHNLTQLTGGSLLSADSITSYVTAWGAQNIAGLDPNGRIVVYWWVPTTDRWEVSSITDGIPNAVQPVGRLTGVTGPGPDGTINVLGTAANGNVLRTWWRPNGVWEQEVVTELAVPI